jgi:hypothetical protein
VGGEGEGEEDHAEAYAGPGDCRSAGRAHEASRRPGSDTLDTMERKLPELVAEAVIATARAVARVTPPRVKKNLEDRLFYVIFQKTRVENDAYGWRPPEPARDDG